MTHRILQLSLALALLAAPGLAQSSTGGGILPSVTPVNQFGYNIKTHPNGDVTGKGRFRLLGTDSYLKVDYECIDVQGGNFVTASGRVTEGNLFGSDFGGLCFVGSAQDNGEGVNAPPDTVSFFFFGPCGTIVPDQACHEMPQPAVVPIEGNIQVRP